jgi:hypothetical protein
MEAQEDKPDYGPCVDCGEPLTIKDIKYHFDDLEESELPEHVRGLACLRCQKRYLAQVNRRIVPKIEESDR